MEAPLAIRRLGWKMPKILNAGDRRQSLLRLIGNLSLNEISASVMIADEYKLSSVMDLSHKVIILAPDSDMDGVARIIQQKGSGWSNLLVSNSPETSAVIEAKLASLTLHPRGLFLQGGYSTLSWHFKICLKSPCTAGTALLALQGLLRQIQQLPF